MKIKFLLFGLLFTIISFAQSGKINGIVTDKDTKQPVGFVSISIKGTTLRAESAIDGKYSLTAKPGTYTFVASFIGYKSFEKQVTVTAGSNQELNVQLQENSNAIEGVVIKASTKKTTETALVKEQQKAVEMKQSIGTQEMERKGISTVEEGLTKVTGITKAESRGLFVRGLEERYNSILINDLQAPSNSPFKKIVPLNLFPTDIVGVLSVYKTFNPNINGDFAGATINIETAEPQSAQTKLGVGFGFVTQNNGNDFLISENANNDQGFFGIQKKYRQLPNEYGTIGAYRLTSTEYKEAYKNNTWNVNKVGAPINTSISFSHTDKFKFGNARSISYILSINGENNYQVRKGVNRNFVEGLDEYNNNLNFESYKYQTNASALLGLKYKSNRLMIGTNSIYIRTTESLIENNLGVLNNQKNNPNKYIRTNQFEQSNYFNNQLLANYKITSNDKHSVKGGLSYVKTLFELPDRKFLDGNLNSDGTFENRYGGNTLNRQHFSIKGNYYVSGIFEYNFKFGKEINGKTNKISLGYNSFENSLVSNYRFFSTRSISGNYNVITNINSINNQVMEDYSNGLIYEREESTPDYKVKLNQFVNAGYLNVFLNLGEKFEVNGGVRLEASDRNIKYRTLAEAFDDPYLKLDQSNVYILPSINSKYIITEKANIRFAASKTITRPILMEVLPIQLVNPDNTVQTGNPNLLDSQNINVDLKYEFFSNKKDLITLGVYGKKIKDPIERIFKPSATVITTFDNSKEANLYGLEIETIFNFSNLVETLENISLGVNTSIMKTKVSLTEENKVFEKRETRELQGASNWVINADLKYEFKTGKETKNTASIVYGAKGKSIYAVGTAGLDNIYEMPFHKLDFIFSSKLNKNISVKFNVDNILNPYQRFELGTNNVSTIKEDSLITTNYKKGVGFGLGLSYTF